MAHTIDEYAIKLATILRDQSKELKLPAPVKILRNKEKGTYSIKVNEIEYVLQPSFFEEKTVVKLESEHINGNVIYGTMGILFRKVLEELSPSEKKTETKKELPKKYASIETTNKLELPKFKTQENDLVYSYSKRSTFMDSPKDYYFSYIFSMDGETSGIQKKKVSNARSVGRAFHIMLEAYYKAIQQGQDKSRAYGIAVAIFQDEFKNELRLGDETTEKLEEARTYFEHYCYNYKDYDFDEVIAVEVEQFAEVYKYEDDPLLSKYRFIQHIKPDLIVKHEGVYKLVEHKTHAQSRTPSDRISPQTLEYAYAMERDFGIKIHSVIFNEIRKVLPKGAQFLKPKREGDRGEISSSTEKTTRLSKMALEKQLRDGLINESEYNTLSTGIDMKYYFDRHEFIVNKQAQQQFLGEMKIATKPLATLLAREAEARANKTKLSGFEYPINWNNNRAYASDYESIYLAIFQGFDTRSIKDLISMEYEPKKYDNEKISIDDRIKQLIK